MAEKKQGKSKERPQEFGKEFICASYFGFSPTSAPHIEKGTILKAKQYRDPLFEIRPPQFPFGFDIAEKIAFLEKYEHDRWDSLPHPITLSYKRPVPGSEMKKTQESILGLEIFGIGGSIGEALLIRTALSLLYDAGFEDLMIVQNSLGDKESLSDYEKMLNSYIRKNNTNMPPDLKKEIKESVFALPTITQEAHQKWKHETPKSMSFLSEPSRKHFKEVVEYIESFDIPYSIDPSLIASPQSCVHTVFEIRDKDGITRASGYRYTKLAKKIGFKKELHAMTATINLGKKDKEAISKPIPKPKFYLVQLGMGAKAEALQVIEILRKAKIPVGHALAKDKLQSQIGTAENMKVSHILLIGQKEAYEKTVVVRDNETRAQESVPLKDLVTYLKAL